MPAAKDFKVKHIHVGKLLRQNREPCSVVIRLCRGFACKVLAGRAKKELKDIIDAGELVSDDVVVDIVKALWHVTWSLKMSHFSLGTTGGAEKSQAYWMGSSLSQAPHQPQRPKASACAA